MPALGVIETLEVAEDTGFGLLAGLVVCALDRLGFERGEERLDNRMVVAVALTRHTLGDVVGLQFGSKGAAGVLRPAVRMMRQCRRNRPLPRRHRQRREGEVIGESVGKRPADDFTAEEVEGNGEVKPALGCG